MKSIMPMKKPFNPETLHKYETLSPDPLQLMNALPIAK